MADPAYRLAGRVVLGAGEDAEVVYAIGGRLTFERPEGPVEEIAGTVLPGLVDVHCHIGLGEDGGVDRAAARAQAEADRDSGVLLARDAGVPRQPYSTRWIDGAGDLPRLIRCGQHIARPRRYIRGVSRDIGPDELPDAAAEEARAGDGWVKLVGDWIDRSAGEGADLRPLWPLDALTEAVARAHAEGARVTTHVFSAEGAADALAAGVDCIEHGTGMDAELAALAAARGVAVAPTMIQRSHFADIAAGGERFPVWKAHLERLHAERETQALALWEAGVPLLLGTDCGTAIPHGQIAREAGLLAGAGVPAAAVVAAASWGARAFLGVPGIEEGASADVVVYDRDPREDIAALERPKAVVLRGRRFA
jgi:imidazolonepropionase-like amidohydrolase